MISRLKSFAQKSNGNVATIFAVSLLPAIGFSGGAMDFTRYVSIDAQLQAANDAAVLAATREMGADEDTQRQIAFDYLDKNFSRDNMPAAITSREYLGTDNCTPRNMAFENAPTTCLTTTARVDTIFLRLFGIEEMEFMAMSQASVETRPMELSFAFDSTGSMNFGSRWDDALDAFEGMLDVLQAAAENEGPDSFRVSLVPYTDRVGIPDELEAAVLDDSIPLKTTGSWKYRFRQCVEPREETVTEDGETNPFTLTERPPSELPFRPSQEGQYGPIYGNTSGKPKPSKPPVCLKAQIVPPTNDIQEVRDELERMNRSGTGRFDTGTAWAWRMVSPQWRETLGDPVWPKDYVDEDGRQNQKVVTIITDGNTTAYEYEVYEPGTPKQPWGRNKGTPYGFQNFVNVCDAMTELGVEVHMIFVAKENTRDYNEHFLPYARDCASRPEFFHPVDDADDLIAAFRRIGDLSSRLRLTY